MKLPPGHHVLVVSAPGFLPLQQPLELPPGNDAEVTLYPRRTEVGELTATVQGVVVDGVIVKWVAWGMFRRTLTVVSVLPLLATARSG